MEDIPHSMDTGHLDPDLRGSELNLGEAEEARDHLTLDITLKGKPTCLRVPNHTPA